MTDMSYYNEIYHPDCEQYITADELDHIICRIERDLKNKLEYGHVKALDRIADRITELKKTMETKLDSVQRTVDELKTRQDFDKSRIQDILSEMPDTRFSDDDGKLAKIIIKAIYEITHGEESKINAV